MSQEKQEGHCFPYPRRLRLRLRLRLLLTSVRRELGTIVAVSIAHRATETSPRPTW
jgi:hypothetical protein